MVPNPSRIAPQGLPGISLTPAQIIEDTTALIERFQALQGDIISQVTPNTATFDNVLRPQIHLQNNLECHRGIIGIYAWQPGIRKEYDAARQAQKMIHKFETEAGKDVSMYELVAKIKSNASRSVLDAESQRYLELTHANFIRNGAGILDENLRVEFKKIQEELSHLKEAFLQVGKDDKSGIWLSQQEVRGLPDNIIGKWETGSDEHEGKFRLIFSRTNISLILSLVKDEQVRRKIYVAHENIHQENADRLEKILIIRDSAARMIGFSNHAFLKLEHTMAGNPQTVAEFVNRLRTTFTPLMKSELESLGSIKAQDLNGPPSPFYLWDWPFYNRIRNSRELGFDEEAFSEFFPLGKSVEGILGIFGELMGMEFERMSRTEVPTSAIWHPEVELYSVWDADQKTAFLGYIYLDLVERKGKSRGEAHARVNPVCHKIFRYKSA
jgi:metallopeptidase MepB